MFSTLPDQPSIGRQQPACANLTATASFRLHLIALFLCVLLLGGCSSAPSDEDAGTGITLNAPGAALFTRVVDTESIEVAMTMRLDASPNTITSINTTRVGSSNQWQSEAVLVPEGIPFTLELIWSAIGIDGVRVDYARQTQSFAGTSTNLNLDLSSQPYFFDEFNNDGGTANNFEELTAGTPPTGPPEPDGGTSGPTPPGENLLNGTWDSDCGLASNGSIDRSTLIYSRPSFESAGTIFADQNCLVPSFTQRSIGTYSEGDATTLEDGSIVRDIDYVVTNITVTWFQASDVAAFNTAALCGITNWAVGVSVDITGCSTLLPGRTFPESIFDIYAISDGQLFIGEGNGTTEADRPNTLLARPYTRR